MKQSLHIRIDPSPFDPEVIISPDSASPSSSSAHLSAGTARTTPTSGSSDQEELPVLCVYDFQSTDPDQLSFRKNEILSIVKQENTGWWAAMRRGGDVIGWVPKAFVTPLTEEMAERLSNVREELRFYEYRAEQLYSAPVTHTTCIFDSEPEPSPAPKHAKVCNPPCFKLGLSFLNHFVSPGVSQGHQIVSAESSQSAPSLIIPGCDRFLP